MSKIMIVEDDPMLVEIYQKKLADAGFEVKIVSSGAVAKDEALAGKPELILLDVVLPDTDGFEVLEAMRKEADLAKTPIYVFSNLSSREDIDRATSLGANGFFTKSNFTPGQLAEEIKKILGKKELANESAGTTSTTEPPKFTTTEKKEPNGKKVLIIEDEDIFIEMFGERLKQEGFAVVPAKNGKWGLKEAEKGEFACILLDMMMPAMNGHEAIRQLRESEQTKNTPIIILSNSALDSEVQKALELGANAYHIKTQVTPGEVAEEVKEFTKK